MSAATTMKSLAESAREKERAERERLERAASSTSSSSAIAPPSSFEFPPLADQTSVSGRVFRRLQRFQLLPTTLKAQSDMAATYLLTPVVRQRVFEQQPHWWHHPFRSIKMRAVVGPCVQGRKLLKVILEYLLLSQAANNSLRDAEQLAEGLVLNGFLSPVNEAAEEKNESMGELYVQDDDYYELVAPGAVAMDPTSYVLASVTIGSSTTGSTTIQTQRSRPSHSQFQPISVWSMTDGATRAGFVHRRLEKSHVRSLLGITSKSLHCYAVVNKVKRTLVLFESDVSRQELNHVELLTATIEYHTFTDGERDLKISSDEVVEILHFSTRCEQERWLLALLDAGGSFLETHLAILSFVASTASLYALRDWDVNGKPFCLSKLRGQVALLVNIPNSFCADDAEQLSELVDLSTTYEDDGFKVVAFPSAQFGDAYFANDIKLAGHLQQTFGVKFPVLATRDVNGPNARDAMLFLKTQLTGNVRSAANSFIEGDFVKFLVDRGGHPVKRYDPSVLPCSIESDIQRLL